MPDAPSGRRDAILRAARLCFLDRGFIRTSISDVIALSGGSRATVYDEFGSKEGLFAALIASILDEMRLPEIADGPPEDVLREVGLAYMAQLMDPEALALYRVVLGRRGGAVPRRRSAGAPGGLSYGVLCRRTLVTLTGLASIWPFIQPSPLSGSVGASKIARTTSMPSITRPNAA